MNGDVPKIFITNRELARRCGVPLSILLAGLKREGIETHAIFRDDDVPQHYCYPCWDESKVEEICQHVFGRPALRRDTSHLL